MVYKNLIDKNIVLVTLLFAFFSLRSFAESSGLEQELLNVSEMYAQVQAEPKMKPKSVLAKKFTQAIKWSGISDEALFDRVEHNLIHDEIVISRKERAKYHEYISWLVQALAYSGNAKYKPTIIKFTDRKKFTSKINRHAERSLEVLDDYTKWNYEISTGLKGVSYENLPRTRISNLIMSSSPLLQRVGVRKAIDEFRTDEEMMDLIEKRLLEVYPNTGGDRFTLDAASWMCRALGESGNPKYIETLELVSESSKDAPVRKWANRAINEMNPKKKTQGLRRS